jgi:predicted transcriptional regulator
MQINFEPNIANQLRALASQSGKSEDFYVQQAVKSFLEEFTPEQEHQETLSAIQQGLDDVAAGRVRPAAEIIAELRK